MEEVRTSHVFCTGLECMNEAFKTHCTVGVPVTKEWELKSGGSKFAATTSKFATTTTVAPMNKGLQQISGGVEAGCD